MHHFHVIRLNPSNIDPLRYNFEINVRYQHIYIYI